MKIPFSQNGILLLLFFQITLSVKSQVTLTKVGAFQVNSLLEVNILDYSQVNNLYLGYINSPEGERIVLIDQRGEIVADEELKGEGPNQYVSNLNCMGFSENGDIWLQTVTHLFLYSPSLRMREKIPYQSSVKLQLYGRKEAFPYFSQNNQAALFSFITNPSGSNSYMPNAAFNKDLIEIFNVGEQRLHRIAPVSDRSMSGRLEGSLQSSLYFIVYALDRKKQKLFLTSRLDDEITIYDLTTHELESRIKIDHGNFDLLNKSSISVKDLKSSGRESLGPRNHKIYSIDGGLVVLDYVTEISEGIFEQKKLDDPKYSHILDPYYHQLIFFDTKEQLSGDIPMPKNAVLMAALPDQRLLFKISDPDVEEDDIKYEVYQIKLE